MAKELSTHLIIRMCSATVLIIIQSEALESFTKTGTITKEKWKTTRLMEKGFFIKIKLFTVAHLRAIISMGLAGKSIRIIFSKEHMKKVKK